MLAAQSKVQIWLALSKKNRWQASCTKMDHIRHLDSRRAACMDQPASYTQALGMEYLEIWFVKPGSIIGAVYVPLRIRMPRCMISVKAAATHECQ